MRGSAFVGLDINIICYLCYLQKDRSFHSASIRPCLTDIEFTSSFHNESRLSLTDKTLQRGPSDLKLFFNSVGVTNVALVAVDEPLRSGVDEDDDAANKRKMSDLTFDETFRPLEESMNLCTPAVNHQTARAAADWNGGKVRIGRSS